MEALAPVTAKREYLKFKFVKTLHQYFDCPTCGHGLNAGRNYQPSFCDCCGQKLDFSNVVYEEEEFLGYEEVPDSFRNLMGHHRREKQ